MAVASTLYNHYQCDSSGESYANRQVFRALDTKPQPIRVVLADDHPIVRDGLRKLLTLEEDIEVVGEASDGREVVQVVQETRPDILILDLRMPYMDGLATLQALQQLERKSESSFSLHQRTRTSLCRR